MTIPRASGLPRRSSTCECLLASPCCPYILRIITDLLNFRYLTFDDPTRFSLDECEQRPSSFVILPPLIVLAFGIVFFQTFSRPRLNCSRRLPRRRSMEVEPSGSPRGLSSSKKALLGLRTATALERGWLTSTTESGIEGRPSKLFRGQRCLLSC